MLIQNFIEDIRERGVLIQVVHYGKAENLLLTSMFFWPISFNQQIMVCVRNFLLDLS